MDSDQAPLTCSCVQTRHLHVAQSWRFETSEYSTVQFLCIIIRIGIDCVELDVTPVTQTGTAVPMIEICYTCTVPIPFNFRIKSPSRQLLHLYSRIWEVFLVCRDPSELVGIDRHGRRHPTTSSSIQTDFGSTNPIVHSCADLSNV